MEKHKKRIKNSIIVICIILLIAIGSILLYYNKNSSNQEKYAEILEDGTKVNTSSKLAKTRIVDDLEITNIQLVLKDEISTITADVINNTNEVKGNFNVELKIIDKKGNEFITLSAYVERVEPGQTVRLDAAATLDFANAYDIEITKIEEPDYTAIMEELEDDTVIEQSVEEQ